jgi:hemoglobin-like flavoprotein
MLLNFFVFLLPYRIFELAPPTLSMFSFGPQFVGNEEALYKSEKFVAHARGVVVMLDAAVNMLGPDLEPVTKALADLGALHVNYGVLPAHYGVVGESLLCTLETALGDHWTPNVQKGWTMIFGYIATAMMAGANHALEKQLRRKNRIAARARKKIIISPETKPSNLAPTKSSQPEKRNTSEVLLDLTGVKPQEPTKKLRELTDLIDDVLVIETDSAELNDDLSLSSDETDPADSKKVNYSRMVANVYTTWNKVKRIPNYTEVAGVLLFRK